MSPEQKVREIMNMSLKVFARYGFKKTTMEEIAKEMHMTKGALYLYFENKQDLYEKAVAGALQEWQSLVKEAVDRETEPAAKLSVLSFKAFQYLTEHKDLRSVLIKDPEIFPMFPRQDPYHAINENSRKMLGTILEEGIAKGTFRCVDVESVTWLLFSIYKMFIIDTYIISEKDATMKLFEEAVELVMHGLLK